MAVYQKLLLSAGGGIVSASQQADQVKNTASILIGLGGTGMDCLRTIKTQVYSRLKPDDVDAVVPTYEHIRFLGVDTAEMTKGDDSSTEDSFKADALLPLDDTEFFSIANPNLKKALQNHLAIERRPDISWLEYENIPSQNLGKAGAGGIRQVGRYMMMDKSQLFLARIRQEINAAKSGLVAPTVNVHIFAGLSGGTGSGSFLDVCYMVRSIANEVGGVTIFGYFFLPDVNLSRIPPSKVQVHEYVPRNGYAAMQELDYCMQLQFNGGSFVQEYQGLQRIEWKTGPVDMCHLICATNSNGDVIPNAYDYAMNVTAEYLMDFLTSTVGGKFDLSQQLANFSQMVQTAGTTKKIGSPLDYCVIGASCASLPLREINTYLASELFNQFSRMFNNMPNQGAVQALAIRSFAPGAQNIDGVYDSLLRQIRKDAGDDFSPYTDDYKYVRDYGNKQLVENYTNQRAKKENRMEANAQSMMTADNEASLIRSLRNQLADILKDINRGPMYAYRMISASESHNLLNVIDGLIQENQARMAQESAQTSLRHSDYENSKAAFEQKPKKKQFQAYEFYLMEDEKHWASMYAYQRLAVVLKTLREQVEDAAATYYIKLNRVMSTLIDTFKENRDALASEKILKSENSFAIPMMTIEELKQSLDAEIAKLDVPNMMNQFIGVFLNNEAEWIAEDENKITKLVTDFFVGTAFGGFANRTITAFLKDKYNLTNDAQLTNRIYEDWMKLLCGKAKPLFYFNGTIWREEQASKLAYISVPTTSAPVKAAAQMMGGNISGESSWDIKESALTDRIYVMCSAVALPLSSYNNCGKYEMKSFEATPEAGRHYYEGKAVDQVGFDWRELPSLTPQSMTDLRFAPEAMRNLIQKGRDLFEEAYSYGMFDAHNVICTVSDADLQSLKDLAKSCEDFAETLNSPAQKDEKDRMLARLAEAKKLPVSPTNRKMADDGLGLEKRAVLEDHFVSAPIYQKFVREEIDKRNAACAVADAAAEKLNAKWAEVEAAEQQKADEQNEAAKRTQERTSYFEAIFTGVIEMSGLVIRYTREEYGLQTEMILSQRGAEFPFAMISVYQGFLTYRNMPQDVKDEIRQKVDDRFNTFAPELLTTGQKLKTTEFSPDRINAWVRIAQNFEQRNEIMEFIGALNKEFANHCLMNGIA